MIISTSIERNIVIQAKPSTRYTDRTIEMCEHKGVGHPDTITDGACEAAACALAAAYENIFGQVLHFNVDKGLLVAGASEPHFGGGRIIEPVKLIVCGRVTDGGDKFDVRSLIEAAVEVFLGRTLRVNQGLIRVTPEIKPGSANLAGIYARGRSIPIANDTSFGVGFAPYSPLEQQVLDLARMLRSSDFKQMFPAIGDDFKIMGYRQHDDMRFTVALALIDRHVDSVRHYFETKRAIAATLKQSLPAGSVLQVNALDDPNAQDEQGLYLTVSGLSAEMGDDGQVGRGNRVNGLITPSRTMSLEAAAGKNPASHVGKIYNVLAHCLARDIVEEIDSIKEAEVLLLSTIGQPLDRPQIALVEVGPTASLTTSVKMEVEEIVNHRLNQIPTLTKELIHGLIAVY